MKLRAIQACAQQGIGVVLTPTLVPGINTDAVGAILEKAVALSPAVRAVHFQPISYFGRYRFQGRFDNLSGDTLADGPKARLTLPELMHLIEDQSNGVFAVRHFKPPGCENARCSFHGNFLVMPEGRVMPLKQDSAKKCCGANDPNLTPIPAAEGALKAMAYVRRQWAAPDRAQMPSDTDQDDAVLSASACKQGNGLPSLEAFISRARSHTLSVSAMGFQDVWNVDLNRVRDCCIHVMAPDHRLIPFCLYNLTGSDGRRLYRK
jgi:uncharacterized radical SAM superfamily Fe-S cluster-containing enzyme